jgi:outer membrane biosynthesis protein TonB
MDAVRSQTLMLSRLGLLLAAGLLASACASARAAAPVERPALEVPPVPPRIVEAAPAPDLGNPDPVPDLPPEKPIAQSSPKPRPSSARDTSRDTQKAEAKQPDPLPPVADPAPPTAAPPQAAAPLIRTPATADAVASEREIREVIKRAQDGLNNVPFDRLNGQRKKAYNEAKDFIDRAEVAIKSTNFELAKELAGKAEKLANELQGR